MEGGGTSLSSFRLLGFPAEREFFCFEDGTCLLDSLLRSGACRLQTFPAGGSTEAHFSALAWELKATGILGVIFYVPIMGNENLGGGEAFKMAVPRSSARLTCLFLPALLKLWQVASLLTWRP